MTTFTTEDRILAEKDGSYTLNVEGGKITMNKPVVWTSQDVLDADHIIKAVVRKKQDEQHTIPLYTHPVKELTDEEILEYSDVFALDYSPLYEFTAKGLVLFARAILRKAQEK